MKNGGSGGGEVFRMRGSGAACCRLKAPEGAFIEH